MRYSNGTHTKRRKTRKKLLVAIAVFFAVLLVIFVCAATWYHQQLRPVTTVDKYVDVTIASGTSAAEVSNILATKQVIRNANAFSWYLRNNGLRDDLQAGTYKLNAADSSQEIASAITEGKVKQDLFTILPGLRVDQIRAKFISAGYSAQEVDEALNAANYKNHPALANKPQGATLEGYLYPDSFQKTSSTTAEQIVRQSLDEMADALTTEIKDGFQKQGLSVHEGVTLASMVVKEANNADDRREVAGVF